MMQKPIIIKIFPLEGKEFKWELDAPFDFEKLVLIEALHKIGLQLHWDHVLKEISEEENKSDE